MCNEDLCFYEIVYFCVYRMFKKKCLELFEILVLITDENLNIIDDVLINFSKIKWVYSELAKLAGNSSSLDVGIIAMDDIWKSIEELNIIRNHGLSKMFVSIVKYDFEEGS
ncbi:hypothetical protein PCK1_000710 [Pneumocystis canis]|nr:hypothetical protein PCK1_000710 [Pneumocystis canis]